MDPDFEQKTVADIATPADKMALGYPDETVSAALRRMGTRRVGRLPIVEGPGSRKVVGVLRRQDIVEAYERAMHNRKDISVRLRELREAHEGKVRVLEFSISKKNALASKTVREIGQALPDDCILVSIRRGDTVIIPHGDTIVQNGDHLVALASLDCVPEIEQYFQGEVETLDA